MTTRPLTPKQEMFCQEYVVDFNGSQAAIRAGYAKGSSRITASQLLTKNNIILRVAELQEQKIDRIEISQDRVLAELAAVGFHNIKDLVRVDSDGLARVDLSDASREQFAAVKAIKVEAHKIGGEKDDDGYTVENVTLTMADKVPSLRLLAQHTGIISNGKLDIGLGANKSTSIMVIANFPEEEGED